MNDAVDAVEYLVDPVGGEVHLVARVVKGVAVGGVDEDAEVGLVDLDDGDAGVPEGEKLVVDDGDEGVDEPVTRRVGFR